MQIDPLTFGGLNLLSAYCCHNTLGPQLARPSGFPLARKTGLTSGQPAVDNTQSLDNFHLMRTLITG